MADTYTCTICANTFDLPDLDPPQDLLDVDTAVCDDCFARIVEGVCGTERRGYACLRPKDHVPTGQHVSVDGKFWVHWTDLSTGVTLRLR